MGNGPSVGLVDRKVGPHTLVLARERTDVVAPKPAMLVCPKCGSTYTREVEHCGLDGERLLHSDIDPLIGRTLDRYRIVEPIGAGGMARVYRATHLYLEQDFAIKVLHGQLAADKALTKRFHREAKALSRIKHPNVVAVADFGATKEGLLFMVMELLEGPTLSQLVREHGPVEPSRAGRIIKEVASGLAAAHSRGFVHRDLKPGNVMLVQTKLGEQPKILDFGLVRLLEPDESDADLTNRGQFFGTPSYMSPEQATGGEVGPASDLYSLGVILYQLLTGTPPFTGDVQQLAHQHVTAAPPVPALAYGGLTNLALDLLQKRAEDRPRSADTVVERIEKLGLSQLPQKAPSNKPFKVPPAPKYRSDPPTKADRSPLSAPILQEERRTSGVEDPREMTHSIDAALGTRRYQPWIWGGILVAAAGAGGVYYRQQSPEPPSERAPLVHPQEAPTSIEPEALAEREAETPPSRPVSSNDVRPTPTQPKPSIDPPSPPAAAAPPPAAPAPASPPPAAPAPASPPPVVDDDATDYATTEPPPPIEDEDPETAAKTFKDLDLALGWARHHRGLSWADLAQAEPTHAQNWARWYKSDGEPPAKILEMTYQALMKATESLPVDKALLESKLRRVRTSLNQVPTDAREGRYLVLEGSYQSLRREVGLEPLRKDAAMLAQEITILESDAAQIVIEALARPVATSTSS